MYKFGSKSISNLNTIHVDLQVILKEVIKIYDFSILEGHRTLETQQEYYKEGKSTLDGINKKSKHQSYPSLAVDIMPYKKGTNAFSGLEKDARRFCYLMGLVQATAIKLYKEGIISHKIRWGGDWDSDDIYTDQTFDDLPHIELIKG